ncbi:MAG: helix-turn-helix transcriptional regulator [Candidatus Thiodiazotropha taylori]
MINTGLIAGRLKRARLSLKMSPEEAGERTGFSARTIRRFEREGLTDLAKLDILCECYGIDLMDIVNTHDESHYLTNAIKSLGKDACRIIVSLCKAMEKHHSDKPD